MIETLKDSFLSLINRLFLALMFFVLFYKYLLFTFRAHVSMVTAEHMNQLLKNVLKLIKKNIGNENSPWMTRIAAYTQQIIINSSEELLKDPFLPLAERVKKRTEAMFHKEESLRGFIKSSTDDTSQVYECRLQLHEYTNYFFRLRHKSKKTGIY